METKPDKFHYHELTDRLHMLTSMVDEYLMGHPVCEAHGNIKQLVQQAEDTLWEAYQLVGTIEFNLTPTEERIKGDSK